MAVAAPAAETVYTHPPLHMVDFHPDVWRHERHVGEKRVVENEEGLWDYVWRVFVYFITFSFCCCEGCPKRLYEGTVTHDVTETFTCRAPGRMSGDDLRRILAYLYAPYNPLESGPRVLQGAAAIWGSNVRELDQFTIVGRRTIANWRETSKLEISYNNGEQSVNLTQQSRAVVPLDWRGTVEYGPISRDYEPLMRAGATFVLYHDYILYRRDSDSPLPGDVRMMQLEGALHWLDLGNEEIRGSSCIKVLLDGCLYGLCGLDSLCRSYRGGVALSSNAIHFDHTGYWIIRLQEDNGRKYIKCILQQPGGATPIDDPAPLRQQLQQLLDQQSQSRYNQRVLNRLHIETFVSPGDGQIGYTITLR